MHRWLGEPEAFSGSAFNKLEVRQQSAALTRHLAGFFATRCVADLESEGARHGVPISGVLSLEKCLGTEHVRQTGILEDVVLPDGDTIRMPRCLISIDNDSAGKLAVQERQSTRAAPPPAAQPLAGLKVLDLGVIVVGGEQSRLLADLGADVVKIESPAFPDGTRQSYLPTGLSVGFAAGHRNKRSLGLDLRHPEGKALFLRLAREADVILSNFKPGTMDALGFGSEEIRRINPGVVIVESSAFGPDGPWSGRMGYGPLVRAASGLTSKWRYEDDPLGYSDTVTIYPDHAAARYGTIAVLALLLRRLKKRRGGTATISQMEVILEHFAAEIAGLDSGIADWETPVDAPWGVFPTRGEDEWCVVTVRDDRDWKALTDVIGRKDWASSSDYADRQGRLHHRTEIEHGMKEWLAHRDADEAMRTLQTAGIPAARMLRIADLPDFGYFHERGLLRVEQHPHLAEQVIAENFHAVSANIGNLPSTPAPLMGEHTVEVLEDWLSLPGVQIEALLDQGIVQRINPQIREMLARGEGRGEAFAV
jgi:crotonobetainyl-CoA:carnitine CoA-transferase CaiB-like acyl-CoA transferase